MHFLRYSFFFLFLTTFLSADIQMDTSINDVFHRGSNELTGSITFIVNSDEFPTASPVNPVFIRVNLDHNAVLGETLVDQNATGTVANPILLAMRLDGGNGFVTNIALDDTISIVRWVAGEAAFWLRIQQPTNTWLDRLGMSTPPDVDREISFTVGISARISDNGNLADAAVNNSNLPFNTRTPGAAEGDYSDAVSTLICTDLANSNLFADGSFESLLGFDVIAFEADAEISPGVYGPGTLLPINFTNDFYVARGKTRRCELTELTWIPTGGSILQDPNGFLVMENNFEFEIDCYSGGIFLDTNLVEGARIRFTATGPGYGFGEFTGLELTDFGYYYIVDESTAFDLFGRTLYRSAELIYSGPDLSLNNGQAIALDAMVTFHPDQPVDEFLLDWDVTLLSHASLNDDPPYDGLGQGRRCLPSETSLEGGEWKMNRCDISSASLIGNQLQITGFCDTGVDVYARDTNGNFILLQSGVIVNGSTSITIENAQTNFFYGVVPAGAPVDDLNFVGDLAIVVPTLTELGLTALVGLMLCGGLLVLRRRR